MQSVIVNNVKAYNVTGGKYSDLPPWIAKQNKRRLKGDLEFDQRIRLIEDLSFPTASLGLTYTMDHQYLIAWGTYKPRFKVYDLIDLTMKFERHLDCDTVQALTLSSDWTKLCLLQSDRFVEFHGPSGLYHRLRIPKMGRSMIYNDLTGEILFGSSSSDLYRVNLERGQFMNPWQTEGPAVNALHQSPWHGLIATAEDGGHVELWDPRCATQSLKTLHNSVATNNNGNLVGGFRLVDSEAATSVQFTSTGLHLAVGNSEGLVTMWDIRGPRQPLYIRDHHHGLPIKGVRFHPSSGNLLSFDQKSVKIYNGMDNALLTTLECEHSINDVIVDNTSGLVIIGVEHPQVQSFFVPALGPAPKWCPFLENLTEELEENNFTSSSNSATTTTTTTAATTYDNYKFVSKADLNLLGLDHLIGTNLLKAYLHGYFIDLRLYERAKAITNPLTYEEHIQRQRRQKLEAERQSRIHSLITDADERNSRKRDKKLEKLKTKHQAIQKDDRFRKVFEDDDYAIDEDVDSLISSNHRKFKVVDTDDEEEEK